MRETGLCGLLANSRRQHRELEGLLDPLLQALSGQIQRMDLAEALAAAAGAAAEHYRREQDGLFAALIAAFPAVIAKMTAQHSEILEIASAAEGLREITEEDAERRDLYTLARRFAALAQHNIIEEERDLFPLVEAWLAQMESS